jgi:hypothetical protein
MWATCHQRHHGNHEGGVTYRCYAEGLIFSYFSLVPPSPEGAVHQPHDLSRARTNQALQAQAQEQERRARTNQGLQARRTNRRLGFEALPLVWGSTLGRSQKVLCWRWRFQFCPSPSCKAGFCNIAIIRGGSDADNGQ